MKGSPLRELAACLAVALLLLIPLAGRHRPGDRDQRDREAPESGRVETIPTWVDVRFSHPVLSARIRVGDREEDLGGEVLGASTEVDLPVEGVTVELELEWPRMEGTPYVELSLEPEGLDAMVLGRWGTSGSQTLRWSVDPGEAP